MATKRGAPAPSSQDLNDAYFQLYTHLNDAYWAAGTLAGKDRIKGMMDEVGDVITSLNAADLATRNDAFTVLSTQVTTVNDQLKNLQGQISAIISRISTAATIISDITKVVSVAAHFFPIP